MGKVFVALSPPIKKRSASHEGKKFLNEEAEVCVVRPQEPQRTEEVAKK